MSWPFSRVRASQLVHSTSFLVSLRCVEFRCLGLDQKDICTLQKILLTSIDSLKSMVTIRRKFNSFHQNNDIVHFRSFQSFARIMQDSHLMNESDLRSNVHYLGSSENKA